jgi:hypothetical protein
MKTVTQIPATQTSVSQIGEHIGIELATKMVKDFFDAYPEHAEGYTIGRSIIDKILAQPGCEGITIYPALDENGKKTLVYAGIDAQKEVITQVPIVGTNGDIRFEEGTVGDRVMNPGGYWNDKEPTQPAPTK